MQNCKQHVSCSQISHPNRCLSLSRGALVIHAPYIYNFNENCVKWNSPEVGSCRTQPESSQRCSDFGGGQKTPLIWVLKGFSLSQQEGTATGAWVPSVTLCPQSDDAHTHQTVSLSLHSVWASKPWDGTYHVQDGLNLSGNITMDTYITCLLGDSKPSHTNSDDSPSQVHPPPTPWCT